jgi:peptidoglycan/xylan/chitin deacetylase (PgdA/CDA1 family)
LTSPAVVVIARPRADLSDCLVALERAGAGAPKIERIRPDGPAMARNRALAACEAEVIALVEDDVLVEPGWYTALSTAWAAADERVACVGGPLRAAFPGGRPAWLSDDLIDAFGTLDLGFHPEAVDLQKRTFHGGNVSFRASALRAVGGFWPARGHPDGRDWFSEEHEAQRELGRAGWRAAYLPSAAAARVVADNLTAPAVLRRRLRYGARRELIGESRPALAIARQLTRSAAGVPLALVRRRHRQAMDRGARVAESAGALMAGPLAHADLQPVVRDTPFRAGVPAPQPRRARRRAERLAGPLVLLYHRVAERPSDPLGLCVSPANFARQLEVLKAERELVPLEAIVYSDVSPDAVALTFDDGYRDNLEAAVPALAAAGVPATLFVSTAHVAEGRGFWWDELHRVLLEAPPDADAVLEISVARQRRAFCVGGIRERQIARKHLQHWLQPMSLEEIDSALAALRAWAGMYEADAVLEEDRPMTPDGVRAVAGTPLLSVGAHSRSHRCLRYADPAAQDAEIAGSRDDLAAWLGAEPTSFSYPFGFPGADFDHGVMARVRAAGFSLGVTTAPGPLRSADRLALPRSVVPNLDAEAFDAWLRGRLFRPGVAPRP